MPNRVKSEVRPTPKNLGGDWYPGSQRQLVLAKRRVVGLEKTVTNWTRLRDEGMPGPGAQSENQSQEQSHSV